MPLLQTILDLFFPPRCPFCGKLLAYGVGDGKGPTIWERSNIDLGGVLCPRCAAELPWLINCCPRCARPVSLQGEDCPHCREHPLAFAHCCALGRYEGALREALHRFKYHGEKALAVPLGRLLAARLSTMPWISTVEMLVPVPLYPPRHRDRGYNQAALLAGTVSRELGIPMQAMLQRTRDTKSQTGLNRRDRWENMNGAFCCSKIAACKGNSFRKAHLLLVDDILTSGATAHAASLVLQEAGLARISVAVIAR
ncbi:MAG: ComF family protein [Bacillota bacterium]